MSAMRMAPPTERARGFSDPPSCPTMLHGSSPSRPDLGRAGFITTAGSSLLTFPVVRTYQYGHWAGASHGKALMACDFDAIVIGTGFGGAVTTCRLAQAGLRTLVLERGRRYDLASLPDLPKPGQVFPDLRRWLWSDGQGLWDLRDLDGVAVAQSAAYGGGSLVYANVHLRPPREVFDDAWPD